MEDVEEDVEAGFDYLGAMSYEADDNFKHWEIREPIYSINVIVKDKVYAIWALQPSSNGSTVSTQVHGGREEDCDQRVLVLGDVQRVTQVQITYYESMELASFTIITDKEVFGPIGIPRPSSTVHTVIYDFSPGSFAGLMGWSCRSRNHKQHIVSIGFIKHKREFMWGRISNFSYFSNLGNTTNLGDKKFLARGLQYKGWKILMPIYSIKVYEFFGEIYGIRALRPSSDPSTRATKLYGLLPANANHRELIFEPGETVFQVSISHDKKSKDLATFTITTTKKVFGPIGTPKHGADLETFIYDFSDGSFAGLLGYTRVGPKSTQIVSIGLIRQTEVSMLGHSTCVCHSI